VRHLHPGDALSARIGVLLAGVVIATGCRQPEPPRPVSGPPALYVETATLRLADTSDVGLLVLEGRFTGLSVDARSFVRFDVGGSARWVRLRKRRGDVLAVRSREHGYALTLDRRRGRFGAEEPGTPARNPLMVRLGQEPPLACVMLELREAAGAWTFDHTTDRQLPCAPGDER
jgi:hypothetical protein